MKQILAIAVIASLVVVPSAALARHGSDDSSSSGSSGRSSSDVRRNDRREDWRQDQGFNNVAPANIDETMVEQAKAVAQEKFPGKTIKKVEFEVEHGVDIISVRFTDGSRVDVDPNGNITRTKDKLNHHNERGKDRGAHKSDDRHHDDEHRSKGRGRD